MLRLYFSLFIFLYCFEVFGFKLAPHLSLVKHTSDILSLKGQLIANIRQGSSLQKARFSIANFPTPNKAHCLSFSASFKGLSETINYGSLKWLIRKQSDYSRIDSGYVQILSNSKKQYCIPILEGKSINNDYFLDLQFSNKQQTIIIDRLQLTDHCEEVSISNAYDYYGNDANAVWRARAYENIKKYRMKSSSIKVLDGNGKPLVSTPLTFQLKYPQFKLGAAVDARYLIRSKDQQYKQFILDHFHMITFRNSLKWQSLSGEWGTDNQFNESLFALIS